MDRLSPELLHVVVSFLDIKSKLQFRLVNKNFAVIGAAYILPEVAFYLHDKDFAKLKEIAARPIFARNVKKLMYITDQLSRRGESLDAYVKEYEFMNAVLRLDEEKAEHRSKISNLSRDELERHHSRYMEELKAQNFNIQQRRDLTTLLEVLPSFSKLQTVIVSTANQFNSRRFGLSSPYDDCAHDPHYHDPLQGVRELEVMLEALATTKIEIQDLRAGLMNWHFFDKDKERLSQLCSPLINLRNINIHLSLETDDDGHAAFDEIDDCREVLRKGMLKNFLKSMPGLEELSISFIGDYDEPEAVLSLDWVLDPGFQWPELQSITLEGFDCSRSALWHFLERHRDKLKYLTLSDIVLHGSWYMLLPDIRNKLHLDDVCIYGRLYGYDETEDRIDEPFGPHDDWEEYWYLSAPEAAPDDMRSSISCYCQRDYPNVVPLDDDTVSQYFETHVRRDGMISQAEDDELMAKEQEKFQEKYKDQISWLKENSQAYRGYGDDESEEDSDTDEDEEDEEDEDDRDDEE
ncbi:hypothetical protein G7054_g6387 [Neopestalotiopsis clavispora]|nr:hypothetical protein G7054_g6387 [Neopestalotiopsis clavispora]